jgi:hypothetical protein
MQKAPIREGIARALSSWCEKLRRSRFDAGRERDGRLVLITDGGSTASAGGFDRGAPARGGDAEDAIGNRLLV